jgi:hypothetical protein
MIETTPLSVLDNVTKSHLEKPDSFRSTVVANNLATIIIIPQNDCRIQLLHHGALFAKGLRQEDSRFFRFILKGCEKPVDGFKEMLGQDIGSGTLTRLAKMGLFLLRNVHHLKIQLETAMFMHQE